MVENKQHTGGIAVSTFVVVLLPYEGGAVTASCRHCYLLSLSAAVFAETNRPPPLCLRHTPTTAITCACLTHPRAVHLVASVDPTRKQALCLPYTHPRMQTPLCLPYTHPRAVHVAACMHSCRGTEWGDILHLPTVHTCRQVNSSGL